MRRNLASGKVIYFRKSFFAPWGTATETVPTWTMISKNKFLFCLTAPKGLFKIPPPPPPQGGEGVADAVPIIYSDDYLFFRLTHFFYFFP
jgi:hypothetical protein